MLESSVKNAISINSQFSNFCGFAKTWNTLDGSPWVTSAGHGRGPAPRTLLRLTLSSTRKGLYGQWGHGGPVVH